MRRFFGADTVRLGPVDGFHQDQSAGKRNKSSETFGCFLATHRDPLKTFELSDRLLDAGAPAIEALGEVFRLILCGRPIRDHRDDAAFATGGAVLLGIVAFVVLNSTEN